MRIRDIKSANRDAYKRDSNGRLGKCYYCGKTVYFLHKGNDRWEAFLSWRAGDCNQGEWIRHFCPGFTEGKQQNRSSHHAYANVSVTNDEIMCRNCYLLMPRTLSECDNCGSKL